MFNSGAKGMEIADPSFKFDLQLFAEGEPAPAGGEGAGAPVPSGNEPAPGEGEAGVVDQPKEDGKPPVQTPEANAAFAQMRREAEDAKKKAERADALIAKQYGKSHGIYTVEQYEAALAKQEEQEQRKEYEERGIDPDVINELIEKHPAIQRAKQKEIEQQLLSGLMELQKEYPDLVKTPEDVDEATFTRYKRGGVSLLEAFEITNRAKIREHAAASAKQKALNDVNGKQHLKPEGGSGSEVDASVVPEDVLKQYRAMNPKWPLQRIVDDYRKHNPRR